MHPFQSFRIARLPEIRFGRGSLAALPAEIERFGKRFLLVIGKSSFQQSVHWSALEREFRERGLSWQQVSVTEEPSPELVDRAVAEMQGRPVDAVIGIGGGSVLDAAKAIAGLLRTGDSVMAHLEGVGEGRPYLGPAAPFIAVPTTAGTGSEATKNAVLSRRGTEGFKKSFRDEQLIARVAVVDPMLLAGCPRHQIAANGMDAFTQLLESYVSLRASPFTDALASSGLQAFRDGFWLAWEQDDQGMDIGFERISYASLCSGITLAQCGLGSVHGLASPLGAFFPIPHGVVCGTLVAEATRTNIEALRLRDPNGVALRKYAQVGELLTATSASIDRACDALVELLVDWTERLSLSRLREFGMTENDTPRVVANCRGGSMQTNPIKLLDEELAELLSKRL